MKHSVPGILTKNAAGSVPIFPAGGVVPMHPCIAVVFLFFKCGPLSHGGIQNLFADPQILGGHLQKLIRIDKLQALLQAHQPVSYTHLTKKISETECEKRVAYEVSISKLECGEEDFLQK